MKFTPRNRKKILVQKRTQLRFARFLILISTSMVVVTGLLIFWVTFSILGERLAGVYPQGRLVDIFQTVYMRVAAVLLLTIPVIYYIAIRFSHHVVGPLPKIYETLRKVGQGDFDQRLVMRKTDELKELGDAINQMIVDLKSLDSRKKS